MDMMVILFGNKLNMVMIWENCENVGYTLKIGHVKFFRYIIPFYNPADEPLR